MLSSPSLRFHADVRVAWPGADVALVLRDDSNAPLKLSGVSAQLTQAITHGTSEQALLGLLEIAYPQATLAQRQQALASFLMRLKQAGMIDDGRSPPPPVTRVPGRYRLPNPDSLARRIAAVLRFLPGLLRSGLLILLLSLAVCAISLSLPVMDVWMRQGAWQPVQLGVLLAGALIWLTLHELSHAVTCRMHGCPVLGAGLQFRGWLLPSAFVNTSAIRLFPQRHVKLAVALAGPVMDLFCLGAVAALNLYVLAIFQPLFVLILCGLLLNITPFRLSDGTLAFQAMAKSGEKQGDFVWSARGRACYRAWCIVYSLLMAGFFCWISFISWQRMTYWINGG